MRLSNTCSCCSYPLLRHIRGSQIYWYCSHCHQEMPSLSDSLLQVLPDARIKVATAQA
ncbi:MAG: hypothetical protein AAF152_07145 [Cyanobacteria bacterium P01_A01_bin.114]